MRDSWDSRDLRDSRDIQVIVIDLGGVDMEGDPMTLIDKDESAGS
jgi:hypothetical protein